MGNRATTNYNRQQRLLTKTLDNFYWTRLSLDSQTKYLERRNTMYESNDWKRSTIAMKEFIRGFEKAHMDIMNLKEIGFSYVLNGKRLLINSQEYKDSVDYSKIHEFDHTGALVWIKDPTKIWYDGNAPHIKFQEISI